MNSKIPSTETIAVPTNDSVNVTGAVVDAVADAEGVSPLALSPPLYAAVDPDALEQFVASVPAPAVADVEISFDYAGHEVTVTGTGDVRVGAE